METALMVLRHTLLKFVRHKARIWGLYRAKPENGSPVTLRRPLKRSASTKW